jgi:hypothetical protein
MKRLAEIREEQDKEQDMETIIQQPVVSCNGIQAIKQPIEDHKTSEGGKEMDDNIELDEEDEMYLQMSCCYNSNEMLL